MMKPIIGIFVTLLVLVIGLSAAIRFDVGGLGTKVIGPYIKEVPVLKLILPEMPEEEETSEAYNFETVDEAVEILKITEKMLKESDEKAENLSEQLQQSEAEVERLKIYESNQLQFQKDKEEFDAFIVDSSEAKDFKTWYESIYPENAATIYSDVIKEVAYDEELQGTISIYQSMKPAQAAKVLEGMSVTKLEQVATIIKGVSSDQAAEILGNMEPDVAAKITSYIYPVKN